MRALDRWPLRAPRGWTRAAIATASLLLAAGGSAPGGYFRLTLVGALALLALAGLVALHAAAATLAGLRSGRLAEVARQPGWWKTALTVVAGTAFAASPLPPWTVFLLERPRLEAAVAAPAPGGEVAFLLLPGPGRLSAEACDRLAGTPPFDGHPEWSAGATAVLVPGTGFLFSTGCYFRLPALPREHCPSFLEPLGGGWFAGRFEP